MESGVTIGFGGDVGVYPHGENYRELELMVTYGMQPLDVLRAATSVNAKTFHLENLGQVKKGCLGDLIAVPGDPGRNISALREVPFVMLDGRVVHNDL
jgi:imidazolonepropionase-like amidohydrolase